jgi:DNA-binding PadR family transcriptional regulator
MTLRYQLLKELAKEPSTIYALSTKFNRSTSVISYELSILEDSGLVALFEEYGRKLYHLTDNGIKALYAVESLNRGEDKWLVKQRYGDEVVSLVEKLGIRKTIEKFVPTHKEVTGCGLDEDLRNFIFAPLIFISDVARCFSEILSRSRLKCSYCGYSFNVPPPPLNLPLAVCPKCFRSLMLYTYESMWDNGSN